MTREINEDYWNDYYDTHNNRRFEDLVTRFFAQDAIFENPKVQVAGWEQILGFFKHSNEHVNIKLVPNTIVINPGVSATELDCILHPQEDLPDFLMGPVKKGDQVIIRMAAVYHTTKDLISQARIYWGQRIE